MEKIEYLEYPTLTKLTWQEKNNYQMSHINVMDLLKRIDILEKQSKEYEKERKLTSTLKRETSTNKKEIKNLITKCANLEQQIENKTKSELALKQELAVNRNEINSLKTICTELEKRIQKYEANKKTTSEVVQKTVSPAKEQKKTVKVGEIIKLGRYEGREIKWQVLDVNRSDNSVLLISKYLLLEKAYKDYGGNCTWRTSTIRKYLNNEFYSETFNEEEKVKIKEEIIKNPDNKSYKTNGGDDTHDKVFLLSIEEAEKYFKTNDERKAIFIYGQSERYWLRTPGFVNTKASFVKTDGNADAFGIGVESEDIGVRPALWVNL